LRGIPVGQSRKPLSRVTPECSELLKQLLLGLGEIKGGAIEQSTAQESGAGSLSAPGRL